MKRPNLLLCPVALRRLLHGARRIATGRFAKSKTVGQLKNQLKTLRAALAPATEETNNNGADNKEEANG
jgi:hypothetical protein